MRADYPATDAVPYTPAMVDDPNAQPPSERTHRSSWSGSWASLRDLEVFRAVIEQGGISSAARSLGVSQPAVSRTISQIEEKSARSLFRRDGVQVMPTTEALQLYEASSKVFSALSDLQDLRWLEDGEERLGIVTAPTLAHCWLPGTVTAFRARFPDVRVTIEIQSSMDVIRTVATGAVDVGIAEVPQGDFGVDARAFRRSRLVVAVRPDHRWASKTVIGSAEFGSEPMVALVQRNPLRAVLDRVLWRSGSPPNIVMETSDAITAMEYVSSGQGVAVINPFPVILDTRFDLRFIPLDPVLEYETSIFTTANRPMRSVAKRFVEHLLATQPDSVPISERL